MASQAEKLIEERTRELLAEKLAECTEKQRAMFHERCYPPKHFPKGIPAERLVEAIDLVLRTIKRGDDIHSPQEKP